MKKLFLFTVLVLAFAATAYGQAKLDFRASGFFDMTTMLWRWNLSNELSASSGIINPVDPSNQPPQFDPATGTFKGGGEWNRVSSYVRQRGRLKFDAVMGKELSGTVYLEMDSQDWGDVTSGTRQQRNRIGYWQGDRAGIEIKNLYFDVAVPIIPVPMTMRFGLQPFGIRADYFMYTDGTGITASAKLDPVTIIGFWAKALEGRTATSDDVDFYALQVNAKINTVTVGGWGLYSHIGAYPLSIASDAEQFAYGDNYNSIRGDMWWLGAYLDGKIGPFNVNADFIYDTGKLKKHDQAFPVPDVKFDGWLARLNVDLPWEAFNFGFQGKYGSGADARKTSALGDPGQPVADPATAAAGELSHKVSSFVLPMQSEAEDSDSEVLFGSYINAGFTGWAYSQDNNRLDRGSYGGLWFAKLYGAYKLTPDYKVTLQGLYIGDTTKHGDTLGTSRDFTGTTLKNNSTIGWEVDLINEWQIYKNLVFRFGGGILFPGDALKFWNGITNEKPSNPWILTSRLVYNF